MKVFGCFALIVAALSTSSTSAFVLKTETRFMSSSKQQLYAVNNSNQGNVDFTVGEKLVGVAMASLLSLSLLSAPLPAQADGQTEKFKLPPIDFADKNRCTLNSSTIGQANAARDKLYDLRQCSLSGANAVGFDLSGVIMTKVQK
jgi:uncharacterized protein YjbI with pentapeptide repeats